MRLKQGVPLPPLLEGSCGGAASLVCSRTAFKSEVEILTSHFCIFNPGNLDSDTKFGSFLVRVLQGLTLILSCCGRA